MRATRSDASIVPGPSYRPDIDGLRAVAILCVVLYHSGLPWLTGGFTGVDIFFVISGYLIGGHIYAELRAGAFSYIEFYRRRAKRILPAFFAVMAFILLAGLVLLSPAETAQLGRSAFAATLSISNLLFARTDNYFAGHSNLNPLLMTWSLGVEEQFYAVIPLLMVLLARIRRNWILPAILSVCILSFIFAWGALASFPMFVFYLLPARAWELGVGVALAVAQVIWKSRTLPPWFAPTLGAVGLGLLLAPVFLLTATTPFPGPSALSSVLGAALIIAVPGSWINRRLLALSPLVFIGKVSYSWYLWHWPILAFLRILYGGDPPPAARAAAIAVSFAAAVLSYFFIEQPLRRTSRAAIPLLVRYGVAGAVTAALCVVLWSTRGLPQRFPALAKMDTSALALRSDPCLAGYVIDQPILSPSCYLASPVRPTVALWGDSHAAALAPVLRSMAQAQGYGFAQLTKASCPPLIGATHAIPRIPLLAAGCLRFNRKAITDLENDRRIRIVILAAVWAAPLYRNWQDGWFAPDLAHVNQVPTPDASRVLLTQSLAAAIRSLQVAGKQVIVIEDVPSFEIDPVWKVRSQRVPARRQLAIWLGIRDAADPGFAPPDINPSIAASASLVAEIVAKLKGASLVDPRQALCDNPGQCAYRQGETLFYGDSSHLSPEGARFALRAFRLPSLPAKAQ